MIPPNNNQNNGEKTIETFLCYTPFPKQIDAILFVPFSLLGRTVFIDSQFPLETFHIYQKVRHVA
jgi:hypothetical protein